MRFFSAVSLALLACSASATAREADAPLAKTEHVEQHGNIPVLHLHGSRAAMGTQYGRLLRARLVPAFAALKLFVSRERLGRLRARAARIEPNLPPAFRTELKAMARSSGLPYADLVTVNASPSVRCTALAAWGKATPDGRLILGRNVDYFDLGLAGAAGMIVVYHPDKGNAVVSITFLGMASSFTGINERGVAYGNLLVFNAKGLRFRADGLPVQVLLREQAHASDIAVRFGAALRRKKHIIPMNVVVADADTAQVAELGTQRTGVRTAAADHLVASNHFRIPALAARPVRCSRYRSLEAAVRRHHGKFDAAVMQRALFDARVKRLNLQAVVFEPKAMRMHVSLNRSPASKGPYTTFDLKKLFADAGNPVVGGKPAAADGAPPKKGKEK